MWTTPGWGDCLPLISLAGLLMSIPACSTPSSPTVRDEKGELIHKLQEAVQLLQTYEQQGRGPARSLDDLRHLENAYPSGYTAIRSGELLVRWGLTLAQANAQPVVCERAGPTHGGLAALPDGTILSLPSSELSLFADKSHSK